MPKVFVKGKGEINLTQQHFVATGGQASVYVRHGIAYKIYTDPKDMIANAKFQALAAINDSCVIKPEKILLDSKNKQIGYCMPAVSDNISLCQLFTKSFRDRNNISNDNIINLAAKLKTHIENIHKANILVVDLNELNILVSKTFDEIYMIDVDSYQTPGYPATVLMPSVRDWSVSSKNFSELSDWFSYGVLTFQMFIGNHPYKGTHPGTVHIPKDQRMEYRMKNNISAFRSDVSLPKCCYSFDVIPSGFKDWLKAVLEDGKRLAPPDPRSGPAIAIIAKPVVMVLGGDNLIIMELPIDLSGWKLTQYSESGGNSLILASDISTGSEMRVILNNRVIYNGPNIPGSTIIGFTPKMDSPVGLNLFRGQLSFLDFSRKSVELLGISAHETAKSGENFYIRNGSQVLEVEFAEMPNKIVVTASHAVADVLEMASRLYEGVVVQNMLGSIFVSLFPRSKAGYQVRLPELDKYKVIDAKFDGGVLMVIGVCKGKYDRLVFRFDEDYLTYDIRVVDDIDPAGLNFITLSSGICVCLTEEEKIEAFSAKKGSQGIKVVENKVLGNDMRLLKIGGKVGFERMVGSGSKLFQMSMK